MVKPLVIAWAEGCRMSSEEAAACEPLLSHFEDVATDDRLGICGDSVSTSLYRDCSSPSLRRSWFLREDSGRELPPPMVRALSQYYILRLRKAPDHASLREAMLEIEMNERFSPELRENLLENARRLMDGLA